MVKRISRVATEADSSAVLLAPRTSFAAFSKIEGHPCYLDRHLSLGKSSRLIRRTVTNKNGRSATPRTWANVHERKRMCHKCAMTLMSVSTTRSGFDPPEAIRGTN